jgi:aspartate/methionine/tyrosine aminotransferase
MKRVETPFSGRIHWELAESRLAQALERRRRRGNRVLDLTESNPTRAGFGYSGDAGAEVLRSLASEGSLLYDPSPLGLLAAREAISRYYQRRSASVAPGELLLTSSTSEAYSYLFKLLCDPGDEVLMPVPGYPLLDFLGALDAVQLAPYPLRFDGAWHIDFGELEKTVSERTRAIVAVHPNNPTGSFVSEGDRERLLVLSEERRLALIVDEVFLDFTFSPAPVHASFAGTRRGLVFVLSGLSKLAALPQMKLAWIAVSGESALAREASLRLEHIADTYLSVGTPVSTAAPRFLEMAAGMTERISARTSANLASLVALAARVPSVTVAPPEGGWYAVVRLPAFETAEAWALSFLENASVYVHPGDLFGFGSETTIVVSLLTPEETFRDGVAGVLGVVANRVDSSR